MDIEITSTDWTEITGLDDASKYCIQMVNTFNAGNVEPFLFTQSSTTPTGKKGTFVKNAVIFKKSNNVYVKSNAIGLNCHVEEL